MPERAERSTRMATANGRVPASQLTALPAAWSNKRKVEGLQAGAAASLSRVMLRAVAHTGKNFSVWSAYRSLNDQVAMLRKHYRPVRRARRKRSDRSYDGHTWAKRAGHPSVASPGHSNHGNALAVDIHPGKIQRWLQQHGSSYGWTWDEGRRVGESWHFVYVPGRDRHRGEGTPDVKGIQKAVGVKADGKFGTGTAKAVKAWQAQHGLTPDGIPGPSTVGALLGVTASDVVESVGALIPDAVLQPASLPTIDRSRTSPNVNQERFGQAITGITVHWWGEPSGQTHDGTVDYLTKDREDGTSAHYVVSAGRISQVVPEDWTAWANGNRAANRSNVTIECDPNDVAGTLPTLVALVGDIRGRHGDLPIYGHRHWVATECPGDYIPYLDAVDEAARTGQAITTPPAGKTSASLPTGKALFMALIDTADFPLLRTTAHRCYYGSASGPIESVSGHQVNSLNAGDVGKHGSDGLRTYQKRLQDRGYTITPDGKYGPQTANATSNLQRLAGLPRDEKVGPDTWHAAWLWPVQK